MDIINIDVTEDGLERLDSYITEKLDDISRTQIKTLINEGLILVNDEIKKSSYKVNQGDSINIKIPKYEEPEILPEDIELEIIYEDEDLLVVNKPEDMVVHPATGNYSGTLVNALLFHIDKLSNINGDIRPGIVHRLDKDTSGLLIIAKNNKTHELLGEQFKDRDLERKYIALVHGVMPNDRGVINGPIGRHPIHRKRMAVVETNSKEAITHYKVIERFKNYTLLELQLETGRTHQLRVHLEHIKYPIVGDPVYSRRKNEFKRDKQLLHARKLGFHHPSTGEYMEFESELPEYFKKIIKNLENKRS